LTKGIDINAEVLNTEIALLQKGIIPSAFFRSAGSCSICVKASWKMNQNDYDLLSQKIQVLSVSLLISEASASEPIKKPATIMAGFVGVARLERATTCSQSRYANQLRYTPYYVE
jgi:hypothetical protein